MIVGNTAMTCVMYIKNAMTIFPTNELRLRIWHQRDNSDTAGILCLSSRGRAGWVRRGGGWVGGEGGGGRLFERKSLPLNNILFCAGLRGILMK